MALTCITFFTPISEPKIGVTHCNNGGSHLHHLSYAQNNVHIVHSHTRAIWTRDRKRNGIDGMACTGGKSCSSFFFFKFQNFSNQDLSCGGNVCEKNCVFCHRQAVSWKAALGPPCILLQLLHSLPLHTTVSASWKLTSKCFLFNAGSPQMITITVPGIIVVKLL